MWHQRVIAAAVAVLLLLAGTAEAADSAVLLVYHRFGDERTPASNTRLDQLDAHIAELTSGGYRVLPLPEIVAALKDGRPLPDKAVAITVDDGWRSVYTEAWPRFKKAGLPFTVFIVTDETDRGGADYMSWAQVREMAAAGVTIGSQGAAHPHIPKLTTEQVAADLERARARFDKELGSVPELLAWPYGETSAEAVQAAKAGGVTAAFGQHSGVAFAGADRFFLPRFTMNETYGEMDRFRMAVRALPLPVVDVTPADPTVRTNPPLFGFTLARDIEGIDALSCFSSHEGRVKVERLGPRIEVRMARPLPAGRARLNCTVPTLEGRWRWFGWQFSVP
ncbi:MAG: polysaccharide deacetylase family protein [Actinomycetota bacterium]